jgi:hypothetical protein
MQGCAKEAHPCISANRVYFINEISKEWDKKGGALGITVKMSRFVDSGLLHGKPQSAKKQALKYEGC